jgi:hypothetical protein
MPPDPYEYQGPARIGSFLRDRTITPGAPLLVPTRANTQPAFGAYFPLPQTEIARLYGMIVLTLEGQQISAITWFGGNSALPHFGLDTPIGKAFPGQDSRTRRRETPASSFARNPGVSQRRLVVSEGAATERDRARATAAGWLVLDV